MKELEIRRKIIHMLLGIIIALFLYYDLVNSTVLIILTILSFFVFYVMGKKKIRCVSWCLDTFERDALKKNFPGKGLIFYLLGSAIVVTFFEKNIAIASILILAFGDSIPNLFGMYFGRIKRPFSDKKFLEGAIVGIIISSIVAHLFVSWHEAIIASVFSVFVEGFDMRIGLEKIDDNLIIPIVSAIVIDMLRIFL